MNVFERIPMKLFAARKFVVVFVVVILLVAACTAPFMNSYYVQQQNRSALQNEPEDWGNADIPVPVLPAGFFNMFSVIRPGGVIIEPKKENNAAGDKAHCFVNDRLVLLDIGLTKMPTFSDTQFADWKLESTFEYNVSQMKYDGTVEWQGTAGEQQYYLGADSWALTEENGKNIISEMKYFRSYGKNPFGLYRDETYKVYGEDGELSAQSEELMKRFVFYRFTGKGGGLVALDNCLIAVDTYSKLIFAFGKPIRFKTVQKEQVPTEWAPVDTVCEGPKDKITGRVRYRFYEYDPVGYVKEDGSFVLTETYKTNSKNKHYDPVFTGKSPYAYCAGNSIKTPAITGTLTVTALYLKNISAKDNYDKDENGIPRVQKFIWDIRSRAYSGNFSSPDWNSLAQKTGESGEEIDVGVQKDFVENNTYRYRFEKLKGPHILELDSEIIRKPRTVIPGFIGFPLEHALTKYGKPLIRFTYDHELQHWKFLAENDITVPDGRKVELDTDFILASGEKKLLKIIVPVTFPVVKDNHNGQMELCYEIAWQK